MLRSKIMVSVVLALLREMIKVKLVQWERNGLGLLIGLNLFKWPGEQIGLTHVEMESDCTSLADKLNSGMEVRGVIHGIRMRSAMDVASIKPSL